MSSDARSAPLDADYRAYASAAIAELLELWNPGSPDIGSAGFWNRANSLEATIDYIEATGSSEYVHVIAETYGAFQNVYWQSSYFDDVGWWGIAWVHAYELVSKQGGEAAKAASDYLSTAEAIFDYMSNDGWDGSPCGGGVWWSPAKDVRGAITNELFLTLAMRLHLATGKPTYLEWANKVWNWLDASGLITVDCEVVGSFNLEQLADGRVRSRLSPEIATYNQGVLLGGLADLSHTNQDSSLLGLAQNIAHSAMTTLCYPNGVLRETCEITNSCSRDQQQFKGIFMRYLGRLQAVVNLPEYEQFVRLNADSIWQHDRNSSNQFGLKWIGPMETGTETNFILQTSALDAFNAAIRYSAKR